jgi:DNA-binding transcriptional MocR family regulator
MLRPAYTLRYRILLDAITKYLVPLGFAMPQPDRKIVGGYFIWLALPERLTANALAEKCRADGVIVAPGTIFEVPSDEDAADFDGHVRLCFAWEDESKLEDGVRRMAEAAWDLLQSDVGISLRDQGTSSGGGFDAFK